MTYDASVARSYISETWTSAITPALVDYIKVPALSPTFDPEWEASGHLRKVIDLAKNWIEQQPVQGMTVSVHEIEGRTPVLLVEVDPFGDSSTTGTAILYGHLDKQPEMTGWRDDLGPWKPVIEGTRLYGRGGADDGYAAFASITAIAAVQRAGGNHGRCVMLIEASEESGSPDLPAHVEVLADWLGAVDLVVCLDSGCATFDTMWLTSSLRGLVDGTIKIDVVEEGIHSGIASGVVPSSFRLMRQILDRIEDSATGEVLLPSATVDIPDYRVKEAEAVAGEFGDAALDPFPVVDGLELMTESIVDAMMARTWRPALSVIGADGLPTTQSAGNVLRPTTSLKVSFRIPPTADHEAVFAELKDLVEHDPPSNARVQLVGGEAAPGWNAPDLAPWLNEALAAASTDAFGQPHQLYGEGGTIPFMGMLGDRFPDAQFVITGVLGPETNAHGPNEFLELAYAERLTGAIAHIVNAHANAN